MGGYFGQVGGQTRHRMAVGPDDRIGYVLEREFQWLLFFFIGLCFGALYVSASFTQIGGAARNMVAALDPTTGAATPWNPSPNSEATAFTAIGDTAYFAGGFSLVNGQSRTRLAAVQAPSNVTAWDPGANGNAYELIADDGLIYAGGDFQSVGGATRQYLAAIDPITGQETSWFPMANKSPGAHRPECHLRGRRLHSGRWAIP